MWKPGGILLAALVSCSLATTSPVAAQRADEDKAALVTQPNAPADSRVALVIGNAAYKNTAILANPANDAEDVAAALTRVGFQVMLERDLDMPGMERALDRFARAAQDAKVALFYYAGHGLQHRGVNYLVPVDARLEQGAGLDFETTKLDDVLAALNRSHGIKILILDACRQNPFVDRLAGLATAGEGKPIRGLARLEATPGLARLDATKGLLVAYSTQANQVAVDGAGRNSPFTEALVKQVQVPDLEIAALFRRVAAEVYRATKGQQLPELSISLLGEFYFTHSNAEVQTGEGLLAKNSVKPKSTEERVSDKAASEEPGKTPLASEDRLKNVDTKLAALPKVKDENGFDGVWTITWSGTTGCRRAGGSYGIVVSGGLVSGGRAAGSISASGAARWKAVSRFGVPVDYRGKFNSRSGSGSFTSFTNCSGTFTARKG